MKTNIISTMVSNGNVAGVLTLRARNIKLARSKLYLTAAQVASMDMEMLRALFQTPDDMTTARRIYVNGRQMTSIWVVTSVHKKWFQHWCQLGGQLDMHQITAIRMVMSTASARTRLRDAAWSPVVYVELANKLRTFAQCGLSEPGTRALCDLLTVYVPPRPFLATLRPQWSRADEKEMFMNYLRAFEAPRDVIMALDGHRHALCALVSGRRAVPVDVWSVVAGFLF